MSLDPPPSRDKDFFGTPWQKWFSLIPTMLDRLYAALAGSSTQTFSVGTATSAAHAVRLDQVGRRLGQIVTYQTGAVATGTTVIPIDDTIPQNTEGNEYMTLAITPASATSLLEIDVEWIGAHSAGGNLACSLFQDTTANALSTSTLYNATANGMSSIKLKHTMTSGAISATTFKVRAGGVAGTTTFNGAAGARYFGGVMASRITIKEWLP